MVVMRMSTWIESMMMTDTTTARVGWMAGIYYGYYAILEEWKYDTIRRQWIDGMCKFMRWAVDKLEYQYI